MVDRARRGAWLQALLVLLAAAWTLGRYGDQEELYHDHGIVLYAGQQVLAGAPPYTAIFDHKGPGAALVCAAGVALGEALGSDDVRGTRFLFLWISAATVAAAFLLARRLLGPGPAPWLAAGCYTCFWSFAATAYSGPEPKTPMLLFQVLALLWAAGRRWLLAGLAASCAFLVWQPLAVFVPVIAVAAWASGPDARPRAGSGGQAEPARSGRAGRRRAVGRVVLGAALPVLAVVGYYAAHGMLFELVDGVALFNLTLMENEATLYANVRALQQAMLLFYKPAGLVIAVGLFALVPLALWRWRRFGGALARDPFFCVLASFPLPVLWSLLDFQGGPDFFVFLPYAALGFAWLVGVGLERALDLAELDVIGRAAVGALAVLAVWSSGWILMDALGPARLGDQRRALAAFEQRHPDARIASVGAPQALVLLERTNPTRYGFVMRGIANHVEAHHPGGYEGWLAALARDADVLLTTRSAAREMGAREQRWQAWLEQNYALEGQVHGPVQAWVRRR